MSKKAILITIGSLLAVGGILLIFRKQIFGSSKDEKNYSAELDAQARKEIENPSVELTEGRARQICKAKGLTGKPLRQCARQVRAQKKAAKKAAGGQSTAGKLATIGLQIGLDVAQQQMNKPKEAAGGQTVDELFNK